MPVTIYTETQCDVCGKIDRREGANKGLPPVGWATITLVFHLEGDENTVNTQRFWKIACPDCADRVKAEVINV